MNKKKCRQCSTYTREFISTNIGAFCDYGHFRKYLEDKNKRKIKNRLLRSTQQKLQERKLISKLRQERQDKSNAKKSAIGYFNRYIVLRDWDEKCISCGRRQDEIAMESGALLGHIWEAGHYKTVGSKEHLRFNLWNCHKQCVLCNNGFNHRPELGTTVIHQYKTNLLKKIGEDKVNYLEQNNLVRRFSTEYYRRIARIFSRKIQKQKTKI